MSNVLTIVLAGGKGERLQPLTNDRAKPAVPFAGVYRIIDFTLSNCLNSGLRQIMVMTQYKSQSLQRHLRLAWGNLNREWGEFLDVVPPQQRTDGGWYAGTADAVYQNLYALEQSDAEHVLILSGDHVYKMDYRELLQDHITNRADVTIACVPVPLKEGSDFGIMRVDGRNNVLEFSEKPAHPDPMPGDPRNCLASMGVYVFRTKFLLNQLRRDGTNARSRHDFGHNIVPSLIGTHRVRAFPFRDQATGQSAYWRDVGTLDAYYSASMDLLSERPGMDLQDDSWRVHTYVPPAAPSLVGFTDCPDSLNHRLRNVLVSPGCIVASACVVRSILSPKVRIARGSEVQDSILLDGVTVGENCHIRRAIIDKGVSIPDGTSIGFDRDEDKLRGFIITDSGLVIIPRGYVFEVTAIDDDPSPFAEEFGPDSDDLTDEETWLEPVGNASSNKKPWVKTVGNVLLTR